MRAVPSSPAIHQRRRNFCRHRLRARRLDIDGEAVVNRRRGLSEIEYASSICADVAKAMRIKQVASAAAAIMREIRSRQPGGGGLHCAYKGVVRVKSGRE